ncbi:MAG: MltA domain-containing protein [Pseudomonadota bacterium]
MVEIRYRPLGFHEVPGWATDDVGAALKPFADCAAALNALTSQISSPGSSYGAHLAALSREALKLARPDCNADNGRSFFEANFQPCAVEHDGEYGLLTGYYEPMLQASRVATQRFKVPIYKRPDELINAVNDALRGAAGIAFTHLRQTKHGLEPFAERAAIEQGALDGRGLELLYFEDAIEVFFLHVQGSGIAVLPDGQRIRVGYDGKNGYPYTSIGRYVADQGWLPHASITLDTLKDWLKSDPQRARQTMWQNKSFIFFRELGDADAVSAHGVHNIPLTAGRSLAVDAGFHHIGLPVFVSSPGLDDLVPFSQSVSQSAFQRLLIAQDVGSAIIGPERGDFFYGSGDRAGALAGRTKHSCNFFVLIPRSSLG